MSLLISIVIEIKTYLTSLFHRYFYETKIPFLLYGDRYSIHFSGTRFQRFQTPAFHTGFLSFLKYIFIARYKYTPFFQKLTAEIIIPIVSKNMPL